MVQISKTIDATSLVTINIIATSKIATTLSDDSVITVTIALKA